MKKLFQKLRFLRLKKYDSAGEHFLHSNNFDMESNGYFGEMEIPSKESNSLRVKVLVSDLYSGDSNPPGFFIFSRNPDTSHETGLYVRLGESEIDMAIFGGPKDNPRPDPLSIVKHAASSIHSEYLVEINCSSIKHDLGEGRFGSEIRMTCMVKHNDKLIYEKYESKISQIDFKHSIIKLVSLKGKVLYN
ncbi:hypothetical protein [Marinagarivorans algicola]|uniref:hypothetical protein n=1 Tax=Marinagarivorans algicola TaxID=1513270 RepID=UPI0006B6307D|nr:hypothetical protein [Marinagarivorans algicola]